MIDKLLSYIAPHPCCGCGQLGAILCDYCKHDIIDEPLSVSSDNKTLYQRVWYVSERKGVVEHLINSYKFNYTKAAAGALVDLLDRTLPDLPEDTVIVPIPTVSQHVRQRGYDHVGLVCRKLAKRRRLRCSSLLVRRHNTVQRGAPRSVRAKQASEAFYCPTQLPPGAPYLVVDDVITTGSTVKYAARELRRAGAEVMWIAAIARQPID